MTRIGVPRALLYYQYYPAWQAFFRELGAEVIASPPTSQAMLTAGSSRVVADTCLPVKVFMGHTLFLVGKCDYVFIPIVRSIRKKAYNCSKFLGLADMTRAVIPECPPILTLDIDTNKGKRVLYESIYGLGRHFTWNPMKIRQAGRAAWEAHLNYGSSMSSQGLTPPEAIERISGKDEKKANKTPPRAKIAVIGHPYLVYDEYINHRLIKRLEQAGNRVVTPEMLTTEQAESAVNRLVGEAYWTYEEEVVGAGGHYLEGGVDGIIGLMAFGCGPDSLMMDMVRRQALRSGTVPFMNLTLEEHTAEAGIITRLEAFTDMIYRKKAKQEKICA